MFRRQLFTPLPSPHREQNRRIDMTTYKTTCWGQSYEVSADWAQASSPVAGPSGGRQVADFRHSPAAAIRDMLEDAVLAGGGEIDEAAGEIDEAIENMIIVGSDEDAEADGFSKIGGTDCYVRVRPTMSDDIVTWRIGEDKCDAEDVFIRLLDEHDMSPEEAVTAMAEDGPRTDTIIREIGRTGGRMNEIFVSDSFDKIFVCDGEYIGTTIFACRYGMDEDEAIAYAQDEFGSGIESF